MPNYDLNRLGDSEFEHLSQSLLKEVIGSGTITFGEGPDGGREATFTGTAPYPSEAEAWEGEWVFQAKFHDIQRIGADKARQQVLADLKKELTKIVLKYSRKCDNYILITNVPLSSVPERGTHDRIAQEIVPEFLEAVSHIHVWGADEVSRFLDKYPGVRQAYLHFLTPGDLIAQLMDSRMGTISELAETVRLYLSTSFQREQYAQLDQAGEVGEERMPLQKVFIDLEVKVRSPDDIDSSTSQEPSYFETGDSSAISHREAASVMRVLLSEEPKAIMLIGGPGEGKSTIGQYLAQIHRATILDRLDELNGEDGLLTPLLARIPFRVILRDYAQWLTDRDHEDAFEAYLHERVQELAVREVSRKDVQSIFKENPCLLVLDGLDEVTDQALQSRMLRRIAEFLARCSDVLQADVQVLATSRPTGYSDQFDPGRFLHLVLTSLEPAKAKQYVAKWIKAKLLDDSKARQLSQSIDDCLDDSQIRLLMNTPLQVTILILIILSGGTPPKQREALFNEYLEVIYKREKAKAKAIIQTEKQLLLGLHKFLGYVLHSRASEAQDVRAVLAESEFTKEVANFLRFHDPYSDAEALDEQVETLVKEARERLVLIVELEPGIFGFELRSLQEFFAAAHLADTSRDSKQRFERFEPIVRPSYWRNVALFFAGRVGRVYSGEAANILEVIKDIDRTKPDLILRRGARLALELASDRSFGPNRRLQHSVIEYGLSMLDAPHDERTTREIRNSLTRLPEEDIRDHVLAVLNGKMSSLAMPNVETALDLYNAFDPSGEPMLEAIDAFFRSEVERDITFAIETSLNLEVNPEWLRDRLSEHVPQMRSELFVEVFTTEGRDNPKYLRSSFKNLDLGKEKAEAVLDEIFSSPLHHVRGLPDSSGELSIDLSTTTSQMLTALELLRALNSLRFDFGVYRLLLELEQDVALYSLYGRYRSSAIRKAIVEELGTVVENLAWIPADESKKQPDLLPHLEACLWVIRLLIDPAHATANGFRRSYARISAQKPFLGRFIENYSQLSHPLLPAFIEGIDSGSAELTATAWRLIERYAGRAGVEELRSALRAYFQQIPYPLSAQVALFGNSIAIEKRKIRGLDRRLEELFGPEGEMLLSDVYLRGEDRVRLRSSQVLSVLDQTRRAIENIDDSRSWKLLWTIRKLGRVAWKLSEEVSEKCATTVLAIIERVEHQPDTLGKGASILFLKLLELAALPEDIAVPVIIRIGEVEDFAIDTPFTYDSSPDRLNSAISNLAPYVRRSEAEVVKGAAKLMNPVLDELIELLGRPGTRRLDEPFQLAVVPDFAFRVLEGNDREQRTMAIKALALSLFEIDENEETLVSAMLECKDDLEGKAWAAFLQMAGPADTDKDQNPLVDFLERILERSAGLLPAIRDAAFSRYDRLIAALTPATLEIEQDLDLPLGRS